MRGETIELPAGLIDGRARGGSLATRYATCVPTPAPYIQHLTQYLPNLFLRLHTWTSHLHILHSNPRSVPHWRHRAPRACRPARAQGGDRVRGHRGGGCGDPRTAPVARPDQRDGVHGSSGRKPRRSRKRQPYAGRVTSLPPCVQPYSAWNPQPSLPAQNSRYCQ